jgi:hypothetical protein
MNNKAAMVFCPPLSDYPKPPDEHSKSDLRKCPKCKSKMWLSEKKKGFLAFQSCLGREIILACYPCVIKMALEDPSLFGNIEYEAL